MRAIISVLLITIISICPSVADQCFEKTCIDVSTENNQDVLITVSKGGSTTSITGPTRQPSIKPRLQPKVWIPWLPKPQTTHSPRPRVTPRPKRTQISTSALMDHVRSAIPQGVIEFSPRAGILIREPIYFRTTVPQRFTATIVVLEVPIQISLVARYTWNFGDGAFVTTSEQGGLYPVSTIRHTYTDAGTKRVDLRIEWSGTWRSGVVSGPIRGGIIQSVSSELDVLSARPRITQ